MADDEAKKRWVSAFAKGETACEQLGGAHLLLHGVWSFKTSSEGERTDLVLQEHLEVDDRVSRAAEGLVLTEWKLVRDPKDATTKQQEALYQAKRYAAGILAGFEVSTVRYLVLVSERHLGLASETAEDGVQYRLINVAVDPTVPSRGPA